MHARERVRGCDALRSCMSTPTHLPAMCGSRASSCSTRALSRLEASNRILAAQERGEVDTAAGIVVGSGGNAGLAYAFAAARLGVAATVIVPETAPKNKVDRLLALGATVIQREGIRSLLESDDNIIAARRSLWDAWRIVIEHGAAAASSALSAGAYVPARGETVAVIFCGPNTDPSTI